MTCEEALLLISGHLDQENTWEEEAQLREHLEHCAECREVLCALEEVNDGILSLKEPAPADLCENVMAEIRKETAGRKTVRRRWFGLAAAAALVAVVGLGTLQQKMPAVQEAAVPMAARSMPAEMECAAADPMETNLSAAGAVFVDPQLLAEERQADIAVSHELLPEMEVCSCETLEDGSLLYCLETADGAVRLSRVYGIALHQPASGAASDVSYALLVP